MVGKVKVLFQVKKRYYRRDSGSVKVTAEKEVFVIMLICWGYRLINCFSFFSVSAFQMITLEPSDLVDRDGGKHSI